MRILILLIPMLLSCASNVCTSFCENYCNQLDTCTSRCNYTMTVNDKDLCLNTCSTVNKEESTCNMRQALLLNATCKSVVGDAKVFNETIKTVYNQCY